MFACLASVLLACIIGALAAQNPAKPGPAEQKGIDSQPVFPKHYYKWSLDDITQNPEFRLPLTAEVQNAIYIQQSTRCERFVSVHNWPYGLGSALHVLTASLADSYNSDQVMVWGKYLEHFAGGDFATEFCEPGTRGTPRCVFEELTDCGNVPAVPVVKNAKNISSHWAELTQYQIIGSQVPRLGERAASPNGYFANKLRHEFGYNTMWDLVHWWRAQGVLWLTRPNEKFAALLRARRAALAAEMASGVPLPLPAGTISMHVRRADKVGEADSVPLGRYFEKAEELSKDRSATSRTIFLSTDSAEVIGGELQPFLHNWTVYYVPGERSNGTEREHRNLATLTQSFLNLFIHMEADHFIGTRHSNWCRLIDELRQVLPGRAPLMPYVDLHSAVSGYEDW